MFLFGGRVNYFVRALNDDFSQCHQSFHLSPLVLHFLLYLLQMGPLINTATDALMKNLDGYAESGEAFNIHK